MSKMVKLPKGVEGLTLSKLSRMKESEIGALNLVQYSPTKVVMMLLAKIRRLKAKIRRLKK